MRYFIEIAYKGTHYHGWQVQPNAISVQEVIEKTLSTFFREDISVMGAGRTDAGVHATQLFAHFDLDEQITIPEAIFKLNSFLPKDISVKNIVTVSDDAHARFNASEREYEYLISTEKDPFSEELMHQVYQKPDVLLMNEASKILLTYTDFQCFSRSNTDVKTYNCILKKAYWKDQGNHLIFTITADRFLRNMVRAIVGTLLDVGYGKTSLDEVHVILKSKDRKNAGASAPAHGLYLTKVVYPDSIFKS